MREEPVVVRGAFGFGLKAIAKAMHGHGLIDTLWDDGPADGLGAMVGAWWCQDQGVPLTDLELMSEIVGVQRGRLPRNDGGSALLESSALGLGQASR